MPTEQLTEEEQRARVAEFEAQAGTELATREAAALKRPPAPDNNGLMHPDRWTMFGRIANTVVGTDFVPKGIRNSAPAIMACLLYGDGIGVHPSVALAQIHVIDGRPGLSTALMTAKIREAGHSLSRKEIRREDGSFGGMTAIGRRADNGDSDEFSFTLEMAERAGLVNNTNKPNWAKYPEAMCWARAASQVARMLFSDVFMGQAVYSIEELDEVDEDNALRNGGRGQAAAPAVNEDGKVEIEGDPWMTARLNDLFETLGERYLPAKRRLEVVGKDPDELQQLVTQLEGEIVDAGLRCRQRPTRASSSTSSRKRSRRTSTCPTASRASCPSASVARLTSDGSAGRVTAARGLDRTEFA
jgi:hypothetical protein